MGVIKRYRKKPVVIEAMRFDGDNQLALASWTGGVVQGDLDGTCSVTTLEGVMLVNPGAYVIRGVKGEFYPCREDIFNETYEEFFDNDRTRRTP